MTPEGRLENTIQVACWLQFILDKSKVTARTVAEVMLRNYRPSQWKGRSNATHAADMSRIVRGRVILDDDDFRMWRTGIDLFLNKVTAQALHEHFQSDSKERPEPSKPTVESIAQENKVLSVKRIVDIPWEELREHRRWFEESIGISRHMYVAAARPLAIEQANSLSGVWAVFRVISQDHVLSSVTFFHADHDSYRITRTIPTFDSGWAGGCFIAGNNQLVSFLGISSGTSSFFVTSFSKECLAFSGIRIGQDPDHPRLAIRAELAFGYRLHRGNVDDPAADEDIRRVLDIHCHNDGPNRRSSIDAAFRAMRTPDITEDDRRFISQGFGRSIVAKDPEATSAYDTILSRLKRDRPEVYEYLTSLDVNGHPIAKNNLISLEIAPP